MNSRATYWSHRRLARLILLLLVVGALAAGAYVVNSNARLAALQDECDSVREAVLASARQCCAIEGGYPPNMEYLEENYNLAVNHEDYLITYDAFSSNALPEVTVVLR